ncbi:trypsin-like peptidase domain-containing protein [Paenibacillus wynnii]|uniref:Serine protease n=1 Tax=Paenibacillus wynnii TaxID=268407 RepID=A0A098M2N5_9BACL|nr:trypsin-like peptidase domain-containing protein [Paenibacillus wynnii]KGE16241.1 hypothetical protein PWYN_15885 [Paenibacillus wynnii]
MIEDSVLCRVYNFRTPTGDGGTMFAVNMNDTDYLITAKHIFESLNNPKKLNISVRQNNNFKKMDVEIRYHNHADIAVMQRVNGIFKNSPINLSLDGMTMGQDTFFLGFPFNLYTPETETENQNFPVPFVKKAVFSSINRIDNVRVIYLDGHNNSGFSGGPVAFKKPNGKEYQICGVISGYLSQNGEVKYGDKIVGNYAENTGIIITHSIEHAIELMDKF